MKEIEITFTLDYDYGSLKRKDSIYNSGFGEDKKYTIQDLLDEIDSLYSEKEDLESQVEELEEKIKEMEKEVNLNERNKI